MPLILWAKMFVFSDLATQLFKLLQCWPIQQKKSILSISLFLPILGNFIHSKGWMAYQPTLPINRKAMAPHFPFPLFIIEIIPFFFLIH
jgi:hypothetical protein